MTAYELMCWQARMQAKTALAANDGETAMVDEDDEAAQRQASIQGLMMFAQPQGEAAKRGQ